LSNSRRKFLKAGLITALFAAAPLKNVLGQSWKDRDGNPGDGSATALQNNDPLANYNKAAFVSYLNSIFQLNTGFSVVAVTLLKVTDMPAPKGGECFTLLFRGGSGTPLAQNTYTVDHPSLGRFLLFVVPVGPDDNGAQGYLATINRLSYADALTIHAGPATNRSGSMQPTANPTPSPAAAPTPQTTPVAPTAKPTEKPKPARTKKPSWKRNDDEEDFGIN
jgi:hypothetical protein